MAALFEANKTDIENREDINDNKTIPSIHMRHSALEMDRRCVLAYLKQRLNKITGFRWNHGAVLPEEIQVSLQEHEVRGGVRGGWGGSSHIFNFFFNIFNIWKKYFKLLNLKWEPGRTQYPNATYFKSNIWFQKQWFNKYNKSLATYMLSLRGLDITQNTVPPKSLKIQVHYFDYLIIIYLSSQINDYNYV